MSGTEPRTEDAHPEVCIPITVFVSVRAVSDRDAQAIAEAAISHVLAAASGHGAPPWTLHAPHPSGAFTAHAHRVMGTNTAARNGYLHTHATPAAYSHSPLRAPEPLTPIDTKPHSISASDLPERS